MKPMIWERLLLLAGGIVIAALVAGVAAGIAFERAFAADYAKVHARLDAVETQSGRVFVYLTAPIDAKGTSRAAVIDAAIAQAPSVKK